MTTLEIILVCVSAALLFSAIYLAVKLRAYRMKLGKLQSSYDLAQKDLKDAFDEVDKVKLSISYHRIESSKILNESTANNAKLMLENGELKTMLRNSLDTVAKQNAELERVEKILADEFEQPAPTPVKQLSDVVKDMEEPPLKVGEWIEGERRSVGGIEEGEITEISHLNGTLKVNNWRLNTSTCKRVPNPIDTFKIGDWVKGNIFHFEMHEAEGEIILYDGNWNALKIKGVNGEIYQLRKSTCKRVPRPVEKYKIDVPVIEKSRATDLGEVDVVETERGFTIINTQTGEVTKAVESAIDWSKPVAFPDGYKVPKGTKVVAISDDRDKDSKYFRKTGLIGITTETAIIPFCSWEDGMEKIPMVSDGLAPINPTDHPLHPEFK